MSTPVATATLLDALPDKTVLGIPPVTVTGVAYDSRKVVPGECFVAVAGFKQDGRRFITDALARGAALVVAEGADPLAGQPTPRVLVPVAREALARLADAYWGHPSRALTLVGVTGTNGKTTTSFLVEALLRAAGHRTGLIGTIQYRVGDQAVEASQTTPEAVELQSLLARMRDGGITGAPWKCPRTRWRCRAWPAPSSTSRCSPTSPRTTWTSTVRWRSTPAPSGACSRRWRRGPSPGARRW